MDMTAENSEITRFGIECRAHLETATAGPRTVPVRSSIAGGKAQECSRPPRPRDVLRAGTARAPMGVSCTRARSPSESALDLGLAACLAFMLMSLSALQVVNLAVVVVVAGDRAAGPSRA